MGGSELFVAVTLSILLKRREEGILVGWGWVCALACCQKSMSMYDGRHAHGVPKLGRGTKTEIF